MSKINTLFPNKINNIFIDIHYLTVYGTTNNIIGESNPIRTL